jgi:hypothetical protein
MISIKMKKLTKRQLNQIHNRCLNLIRRKPPTFFIFRKLSGYYGVCDYENDVVELDPRRDVVRTAYHECVHYLYPNWSETQVLYAESRLINVLSVLDVALFLKYLSDKLYKSELKKVCLEKRKKKKKKIYKNSKR